MSSSDHPAGAGLEPATPADYQDSAPDPETNTPIPLHGQVRFICLNCEHWSETEPPKGQVKSLKGICHRASEPGAPMVAFSLVGASRLMTEPDFFCSAYQPNEKVKARLTDPRAN